MKSSDVENSVRGEQRDRFIEIGIDAKNLFKL